MLIRHTRAAKLSAHAAVSGFLAGLGSNKALLDSLERVIKFGSLGIEDIGVDPATLFDGTDTARCQAQAHGAAQKFGRKRADLQVRLKTRARLAVRMADTVAKLDFFLAHGANTGHGIFLPRLNFYGQTLAGSGFSRGNRAIRQEAVAAKTPYE